MAQTSGSHAWKFPTSPRSPYKLKGDLVQLNKLNGQVYNVDLQVKYAKLLSESGNFEGEALNDPAFSGRDRLRGLRILGLVYIPESSKNHEKIEITEAGKFLLNCEESAEEYFFERQISKVQFRSPLHNDKNHDYMNVRPLTLIIKLLQNVKSLTKDEFALFAITTTNAKNIDSVIEEILSYRTQRAAMDPGLKRKQFFEQIKTAKLVSIYQNDLNSGRTKLREGGNDFFKTKWQTLRDYADSSIRYLTATGLFTINPKGQTFELTKNRIDDSDFLLKNLGIESDKNAYSDYEDYVSNYLGSITSTVIRKDEESEIKSDFYKIIKSNNLQVSDLEKKFLASTSSAEKINVLSKVENLSKVINRKNEGYSIKNNSKEFSEDILNIYNKILDRRSDLLDKPLMLEWNTWRAFELINDALQVTGNFITDSDGNPTRTAAGKKPDILIEYENFWLVVEVTLQSGYRQYETEGSPITRHLGVIMKDLRSNGDDRPVFGVFIATKVNSEVVSYLYSEAWRKNQVWGGEIKFVPLDLNVFMDFFKKISENKDKFNNTVLLNLLNRIFDNSHKSIGELDWLNKSLELISFTV